MHGLLHANEVDTTSMHAEYDDLQATIDNLSNTLFTLKDEVGGLLAVGSVAIIEIMRASVDREVENKDVLVNVADLCATQAYLTNALDRLMMFVAKAALVLKSMSDKKSLLSGQQDTGSFLTYKKNDKSDGVMGRIQKMIEDVKALACVATAVQQEVDNAYETFISDSNQSTAGKCKSIAEITAEIGTQDDALVTARGARKGVMADLESLINSLRRTSALTERRARPFPRT